jgi:hypothetical protein
MKDASASLMAGRMDVDGAGGGGQPRSASDAAR